jgi:hypothetical protein
MSCSVMLVFCYASRTHQRCTKSALSSPLLMYLPCCCFLRYCSTTEAAKKHPKADVFVNYASFRR